MFLKFSRQEFEKALSQGGLKWEQYLYHYADTEKAGELAYAIPVGKWAKVIVYSTILPPSQANIESGISEQSRQKGSDCIRFVVEYTNAEGSKKGVGSYPRLYRRRASIEDLLADVVWVLWKLQELTQKGLKSRCACGCARPPRFKKHSKTGVTDPNHWFLGGCLKYGECPHTK